MPFGAPMPFFSRMENENGSVLSIDTNKFQLKSQKSRLGTDSIAPARSALAGLCPAMRDKFLSPVGFIAPAQSASRPLPLANPFRHFPNGSSPSRTASS